MIFKHGGFAIYMSPSYIYVLAAMQISSIMELHKLHFWTSHHQFYIADSLSPFRTDSDMFWTTQAQVDKLAIEDGVLGVGTECYGDVRADLVVLENEPDEKDFTIYDHVVEGSLQLPSGKLKVIPCTSNEPALQLTLQSTTYRVRIYSSNLASVDGDSGDDYYQIRLWPAQYAERKVLKC
jgi:hypothetical protein